MLRMHNFIKSGHYTIGCALPAVLHGNSLEIDNSWKVFTKRFCTTSIQSPLHIQKLECRLTRRLFSTYNHWNMKSHIDVEPRGHLLVDEDLDIKICGLYNRQTVSVYAYLSEDDKQFESSGCYVADDDGYVSLKECESTCGTYTGISSMGLFWSMVPCPDQREGIRLMKRNVDTPLRTTLTVYDGHHNLCDLRHKSGHSALCATSIERWYKDINVRRVEITDGKLRGTYFIPPGPGPFPSVIDLYGTTGGLADYRAALLASRGIASLALAYFRYKDLPHNLMDLNLDYFLDAVEWLSRETGNERIGVVGLSKGGEIALLLATQTPKVSAVVNINGCAFNSVKTIKYSRGDIPCIKSDENKLVKKDGKIIMNKSYDFAERDIIKAWKGDAKILNIKGEDDLCCPTQSISLLKKLYPNEKTDKFIIASYPGAGHVIDPPYSTLCNMGYHRVFNTYMVYGGTPEQHAFAQEDMWRKTINFLHEELQPNN